MIPMLFEHEEYANPVANSLGMEQLLMLYNFPNGTTPEKPRHYGYFQLKQWFLALYHLEKHIDPTPK